LASRPSSDGFSGMLMGGSLRNHPVRVRVVRRSVD
jgi:hypothetical protein